MKSLKLIIAHFAESYLNDDEAVSPIQKRVVAVWVNEVVGAPMKEFDLKDAGTPEKLPEEIIASYIFDTIAEQIKNGKHWSISYYKDVAIENILVGSKNNFREFEDEHNLAHFSFRLFKEKLCTLLR